MTQQVELTSFDLRYQGCRLRTKGAERSLLNSIIENGIRNPLRGIDGENGRVLLDGFKRYRCAEKLGIGVIGYSSMGKDEAMGVIQLLRISNEKSLSILEQARLIDELRKVHRMRNTEIAELLEKSKAWVSVRTGLISEISETVLGKIMNGEFPAYSYLYTLRQFIRLNKIDPKEVNEFVTLLAGKNLSVRYIEMLANGFFRGGEAFREQIRQGNLSWGLRSLKEQYQNADKCTPAERSMLKDLEIVGKYMQRLISKSRQPNFSSASFYAQMEILTAGILRQMDLFQKVIGGLHDRSGQTTGNLQSS